MDDFAGRISDKPLTEALSERYLAYALSTIVSRSLPDVRDGLKPVHRRLMFAMRELKLNPEGGFKKCARVVGDVIGKYHPHGDSAVYEAMVRLAQDFAVRYPLVEGQGNFGNIDGDNAAAMRYTEARLTAYATALMDGLDEDAVDFRPTYDGEENEPIVMPGAVPNLLANGAAGIAVGMATNIPPHNVGNICAALVHLLEHENARLETLLGYLQGPDFPTGGQLAETPANLLEAYSTGRGSFRLRARWQIEDQGRGAYTIIVTEIPYQVQKAKVIERIAELMEAKKLPLLADVRDESAEDIRIVLEPRSRTVEADILMEHLYKLTDLEVRFGLNMNVLDGEGTPRVMNLREVLGAFIDHRFVVLRRRTSHRLEKIARRLEILGGYLVAYLNLDEVIRIIREEDAPKAALITAFDLTDTQAEAILNMRLRALRKLEEMEIRREHDALTAEQADLKELLADEGRQRKVIKAEVKQVSKDFGDPRRTDIIDPPTAEVVPIEAFVEREPITVVLSQKGWVRAFKGHLDEASVKDAKFKDGDGLAFAVTAQTTDKIVLFASNGRFYTLAGDKLPRGRGFGEPVRLFVDMPNEDEPVALLVHDPARKLLLAASDGRGFAAAESEVLAQTKNGKQVLNPGKDARAVLCRPIAAGDDRVAVIGKNRKLLVFALDELPELARGRGVILQRYKDGGLSDAKTFVGAQGLTWKIGERTRTETDLLAWTGARASAGKMPPQGFPRSNRFDGLA